MNLFKRLFNREYVTLDLNKIQGLILRSRPIPYFGINILIEVKEATKGRNLIKHLLPSVTSAEDWHIDNEGSITLCLSYKGLEALGLDKTSLDSFPKSFRQGMAARSRYLDDEGENSPEYWQEPFKSGKIHIAVNAIASSQEKLNKKVAEFKAKMGKPDGFKIIFEGAFSATGEVKNSFGFRDGISNPEVEGSGIDQLPGGQEKPIKPGEFILGYPGESGTIATYPKPDILGKNGSFMVIRKYHSKVHLFNQYLKDNARTREDQELLAAKMFGRWRSGAPLAICPHHDDPKLGADMERNNDFKFGKDDLGYNTPLSCHIRRMNPRDTKQAVLSDVNIHRIIRRSVTYGDIPGDDMLKDDGKERGIYFIGISAKAMDTIEFLQKEWVNTGNFINAGNEKDPIIGVHENDGHNYFTVPSKEERKRIHGVKTFNVMQGGEYLFIPSIDALTWIANDF